MNLPDDAELRAHGFTPEQIDALRTCEQLVQSGRATNAADLQGAIGYGVIDEAVLRDTFFKD